MQEKRERVREREKTYVFSLFKFYMCKRERENKTNVFPFFKCLYMQEEGERENDNLYIFHFLKNFYI